MYWHELTYTLLQLRTANYTCWLSASSHGICRLCCLFSQQSQSLNMLRHWLCSFKIHAALAFARGSHGCSLGTEEQGCGAQRALCYAKQSSQEQEGCTFLKLVQMSQQNFTKFQSFLLCIYSPSKTVFMLCLTILWKLPTIYAEVKRYCFILYTVGLVSFEKAKELKLKHSNVLLITKFVQSNIISQELPVMSMFLFHVFVIWKKKKKSPLWGRCLHPQTQLVLKLLIF